MNYVLAICIVAGLVFGAVIFRDPEWAVRAWGVVGFIVTIIAAFVSTVAILDINRKPSNQDNRQ